MLAIEAGWVVSEVGRQPWVIYGVMRTRDAVTPAPGVGGMFAGFTALYAMLGVVLVVLLRSLAKPPSPDAPSALTTEATDAA
jgi:cytochrome d ubiquinol oxidase subunit I